MKYIDILDKKESKIILNIPHGSCDIPKKFLPEFVLSKDQLDFEKKVMADLYTDEIYIKLFKKFGGIISRISRIVVDIERFKIDKDEPMSNVGMGVLYTKTSTGKKLRLISQGKREEYIKDVYDKYHKSLTELVSDRLNKFNECLIIDCHSFPSTPRIYESDQKNNRPDICLGVDNFHTPNKLKKILKSNFEKVGFRVKYNSPFSGTIVPSPFYKKNKKVCSVMIEINRRLYMSEDTFSKHKSFKSFSKKICEIIENSYFEFIKLKQR